VKTYSPMLSPVIRQRDQHNVRDGMKFLTGLVASVVLGLAVGSPIMGFFLNSAY
jgi:tetrahydromethanopterin S-methyltransferase subunit B